MKIETVIVACVLIVISLAVAIVPLIYGAVKKRRVLKPVEYLPPCGASPIDFLSEYYGSSANPREIFNPLMLYWAAHGYITIEEDCKRGLKLTKLKDLQPRENQDGFNAQTFELELDLFNYLFTGKQKVFYTLAAHSIFKERYNDITEKCRKQATKISSEKSKKFTVISLVSSIAMLLAVTIMVGVSLETNAVLMMIFPLAAIIMSKIALSLNIDGNGMPKGSAERFFVFPFFTVAGGVPFTVLVASVPVEAAIVLTAAVAACIFSVHYLSEKIDIRTGEQLKTYARICGFKRFLLFAEARQLEMLVEENPQYYYNILPYCYILKITKKLKPKFDRIVLDGPAWYLGELRDILMF